MNVFFKIDINIMQLIHKLDIKFKIYKFIMNINNVQHNLRIFVIFFNNLMIIIIETLSNNHAGFKFDNVNKELKIIEHQSIDNIFASFNIINIEFQNKNKN